MRSPKEKARLEIIGKIFYYKSDIKIEMDKIRMQINDLVSIQKKNKKALSLLIEIEKNLEN